MPVAISIRLENGQIAFLVIHILIHRDYQLQLIVLQIYMIWICLTMIQEYVLPMILWGQYHLFHILQGKVFRPLLEYLIHQLITLYM